MDHEELMRKLQEAFQTEAAERLNNLSLHLVSLEKNSRVNFDMQLLDEVFREAHSLKGAARSVGYEGVEGLCQSMENIFADWKKRKLPMVAELFDYLHKAVAGLQEVVQAGQESEFSGAMHEISKSLKEVREDQGKQEESSFSPIKEANVQGLKKVSQTDEDRVLDKSEKQDLETEAENNEPDTQAQSMDKSIEEQEIQASDKTYRHKRSIATATVRIPAFKLDSLLHKVEELIPAKLLLKEQSSIFEDLNISLVHVRQKQTELQNALNRTLKHLEQSRSFSAEQFHGSLSAVLELVGGSIQSLQDVEAKFFEHKKATNKTEKDLGIHVDELLEDIKEVLMLPFSTLFAVFPGMVRELARDQGKEVELILDGEEVEIDKRILEKMKDPLIHLVRNAVDHGLESAQIRVENNKPAKGNLRLSISRLENQLIGIQVVDDGKGIDVQGLKEQAIKAGYLSENELEQLSEHEALKLLFKPALSTSSIITEISGQGMGMNIVQETVEELGGSISILNNPGAGAIFDIKLPVSLTTYKGLLIKVAQSLYVVPSTNVQRALRIKEDDIRTYENREAVILDDQVYSLLSLSKILGQGNGQADRGIKQNIILLGLGERFAAYKVDQVLGEQEVLVKGLGPQLKNVPYIAGATILGKGKVIPVLSVRDLLQVESSARDYSGQSDETQQTKDKSPETILVVEDTITSRMLLKNILQGSGYEVQTAVDGKEALACLKTQSIDVVVSDVEMPRMDGFELTRSIRADERLREIPVVLVTARESRQDREQGIEAGANAYIVKSGFDQTNLLEVLTRLV